MLAGLSLHQVHFPTQWQLFLVTRGLALPSCPLSTLQVRATSEYDAGVDMVPPLPGDSTTL